MGSAEASSSRDDYEESRLLSIVDVPHTSNIASRTEQGSTSVQSEPGGCDSKSIKKTVICVISCMSVFGLAALVGGLLGYDEGKRKGLTEANDVDGTGQVYTPSWVPSYSPPTDMYSVLDDDTTTIQGNSTVFRKIDDYFTLPYVSMCEINPNVLINMIPKSYDIQGFFSTLTKIEQGFKKATNFADKAQYLAKCKHASILMLQRLQEEELYSNFEGNSVDEDIESEWGHGNEAIKYIENAMEKTDARALEVSKELTTQEMWEKVDFSSKLKDFLSKRVDFVKEAGNTLYNLFTQANNAQGIWYQMAVIRTYTEAVAQVSDRINDVSEGIQNPNSSFVVDVTELDRIVGQGIFGPLLCRSDGMTIESWKKILGLGDDNHIQGNANESSGDEVNAKHGTFFQNVCGTLFEMITNKLHSIWRVQPEINRNGLLYDINHATLFVSIHTNSYKDKRGRFTRKTLKVLKRDLKNVLEIFQGSVGSSKVTEQMDNLQYLYETELQQEMDIAKQDDISKIVHIIKNAVQGTMDAIEEYQEVSQEFNEQQKANAEYGFTSKSTKAWIKDLAKAVEFDAEQNCGSSNATQNIGWFDKEWYNYVEKVRNQSTTQYGRTFLEKFDERATLARITGKRTDVGGASPVDQPVSSMTHVCSPGTFLDSVCFSNPECQALDSANMLIKIGR
ncbi:MAG: hypothetical protein P857_128 [Candidatus Xenolissoclinum pacificiensis L6]|uniref:Uncharacterized protein n=1 Tax=Candidatus Xenolissoclinum pacificiensis L6 TaxID=1401685 RepID=W2V0R5_9RICK|nr:MAG: hypothetical protein P857_128 [Candidatus Xenolissoclinum pacificiensis L6]